MTLPEIDHVSFLVEHAQTFFAGEDPTHVTSVPVKRQLLARTSQASVLREDSEKSSR